uniref:HMG box domain-containing protein n=1 Tax=Timema tahoe TaxID=61484 RepID=A0A7R9P079_9NEOP|nr:unnamed protein product [Timema tahoe]
MPPKRKKPPAKGAYCFYVEDYVQKIRDRGGRIEKQVAWREAGESFENLTPQERAVYDARAKEYKAKVRGNPETKYTTSGHTYAEIDREDAEKKEKQERIEREIEEQINKLKLTPSLNQEHSDLATHPFYFMHANIYGLSDENIYLPCELALAEFTLLNGVQNTYHTLVDPGALPVGMAGIATRTSADTHKIPYPITKENKKEYHYENDYSKIHGKIKQFVMAGSTASEKDKKLFLPPIFTYYNKEQFHYNKDNEVLIESVLQFLCDAAAVENNFRVLPLMKLFYEMRNACSSSERFPKISLAEAELEKDVFAYTPKIGCEFHEKYDANIYCSLSLVRRWGFLIADHCCKFLNIPLKDGFHCPVRSAKTHSLDSRPSSVWQIQNTPASPVRPPPLELRQPRRTAQEMSAALVAGTTAPSPSPQTEREFQRLPDSASSTGTASRIVAWVGTFSLMWFVSGSGNLCRPLSLSSALAQAAPPTLSTAWTALQSMFSNPSVTSSPLYTAPKAICLALSFSPPSPYLLPRLTLPGPPSVPPRLTLPKHTRRPFSYPRVSDHDVSGIVTSTSYPRSRRMDNTSYFDAISATGPPLLSSEQFPSLLGRNSGTALSFLYYGCRTGLETVDDDDYDYESGPSRHL